MKESKIQNKVPHSNIVQGAFLNGAMMPEIDKLNNVCEIRAKFFKKLFSQEGNQELSEEEASKLGTDYSFMNPGYLLGMMYCLIVVPKELTELPKEHQIFRELPIELFTFSLKNEAFKDNPGYYLLRYLRNAIAHVNFEIFEVEGINKEIIFWNINQSKECNWKASIIVSDLYVFLTILGRRFWHVSRNASQQTIGEDPEDRNAT